MIRNKISMYINKSMENKLTSIARFHASNDPVFKLWGDRISSAEIIRRCVDSEYERIQKLKEKDAKDK